MSDNLNVLPDNQNIIKINYDGNTYCYKNKPECPRYKCIYCEIDRLRSADNRIGSPYYFLPRYYDYRYPSP